MMKSAMKNLFQIFMLRYKNTFSVNVICVMYIMHSNYIVGLFRIKSKDLIDITWRIDETTL